MATSTTRKAFRQKVLKKLYRGRYPIVSTTTAIGTGTTNMEDSALVGGALDNDYLRAWIYIVETVASGPAYGEVSRVTNQSSGDLTLAPAFTATPQTGTDYEMHYIFHPEEVNDTLDEVLEKLEFPSLKPISLGNDPLFDTWTTTTDLTSWTETNCTLAQNTSVVRNGSYSARVTLTDVNGGIQLTTAVPVITGNRYFVSALVYVATGDSAVLKLLNTDSADAVIESARSDQTGWAELCFTATIPSGCERVTMRLESPTSGDIFYADYCTILPIGSRELILPSTVDWGFDVKKVFYYPRGSGISTTTTTENAYNVGTTSPKFWSHFTLVRDEVTADPYKLYLDKVTGTDTLWVVSDIDYPAFSGASAALKDADTTKAPMDLAVPLATVELLDRLAEKYEEQGNDRRASVMQARADRIRAREIDPIARKWYEFKALVEGAI